MKGTKVIDVAHVAKLANLSVTSAEETKFATQFANTLKTVDLINELNTSSTSSSYQVTGLSNITRADIIDQGRILSQDQALNGARQTYNGYFVVPAIFDND